MLASTHKAERRVISINILSPAERGIPFSLPPAAFTELPPKKTVPVLLESALNKKPLLALTSAWLVFNKFAGFAVVVTDNTGHD